MPSAKSAVSRSLYVFDHDYYFVLFQTEQDLIQSHLEILANFTVIITKESEDIQLATLSSNFSDVVRMISTVHGRMETLVRKYTCF